MAYKYSIEWKEVAIRELRKLQQSIASRIVKAVDSLKEDPFSKDFKKLRGSPDFRLRVGDFRVIIAVEQKTLIILKIAKRGSVYK